MTPSDKEIYRPLFADLYSFMDKHCRVQNTFEGVRDDIVRLSEKHGKNPGFPMFQGMLIEIVNELERLYKQDQDA